MNTVNFLNKYKNSVFNVGIVLVAVFVAAKIYGFIESKKIATEETRVMEQKKNEVLGEISGLEGRLAMYKNYLNKKDLSASINTIGNIARESSAKIISVKPTPEESYTAYIGKYPFDLILEVDNYHSLGKFISRLESHPDVYAVEVFSISPQRKKVGEEVESKLIVNVRVSTFLFKG